MESLPADLCTKIFFFLDHQNLASALQVSRKWKILGSDDNLWCNLFKERWGEDRAAFYAPDDSKTWKDVYEVQDRCDRVGLGLKIIREGSDYYLVHRGEIQRHLASKRQRGEMTDHATSCPHTGEGPLQGEEPCEGLLDRILFFIGDLEVASSNAKRGRLL